ncbi:hypothetical protein DFH07DRAFT_399193 [Mycena maculata]|uniref:RING-type domain-containing protein n=1 Tax=Mycena maculata TaxID=230809 RepID=A0AAD7NJR8_9AGAR|nr:hypothetical protein DFH07DRAFT_399193 [Mycena maculata]
MRDTRARPARLRATPATSPYRPLNPNPYPKPNQLQKHPQNPSRLPPRAVKRRAARLSGPPWPPGDPEDICHPCRRKTGLMTMKFDQCPHAFCVRCIMLKFEPYTVPFALYAKTEECPLCSDTCNCDKCTSRRGESYLPLRPRPALGTSVRVPPATAAPPAPKQRFPSLDDMVIEPVTYCATMYDMTGAPIAKTFMGVDGNDRAVVTRRLWPRHEFIGAVPQEWGLGQAPVIFIEPTPILAKKRPKPGEERYYIGDKSVLSLPVLPRPLLPTPTAVLPAAASVPFLAAASHVTPSSPIAASPPPAAASSPLPALSPSPPCPLATASSAVSCPPPVTPSPPRAASPPPSSPLAVASSLPATAHKPPPGPMDYLADFDSDVDDSDAAGEED